MSDTEAKVVTEISATRASLKCPHCDAEVDGWLHDPRGRDDHCDECKKPYKVAPDARVRIW